MTNQVHPWKRSCYECKQLVEVPVEGDGWETKIEHDCKARLHIKKLRQFPFKTTNCDDWTAKEET